MKKISLFFTLISLSILFIFSCKKEKNDAATVDYGSSNNSLRTTVTGIVLDESNAPLTGVAVTAYGQTTSTNQYGTFVLKNLNVNKERCVLQFVKTGFFKRAHGFIASGNTVNYVRIILLSNAATQNFSSSAGGTIFLPDGSSAAFQPNSIVTTSGSAYTGTVNLIVKHLSPDDVNFGFTIPGGDLAGMNANEEDVILYTYGMLGVELIGSSGEALQLATGTSATLTLSIAASQLSSAPATIPLWFFDETTSLWKEEGMANKVGNNYVGTVAHFSWWNYDYSGPKSFIKGKVIDCNGLPVPNVVVSLNGIAEAITDQNGEYNIWVPAGLTLPIQIQVLTINNNSYISNSQPENIPSLLANQLYVVPDLIISCLTRVKGTIKSCTGEATDGFVSISNNTFYIYQYITNGAFSLSAPPNVQMILYSSNSFYYHSQNINTLIAPNDLNVGNLSLCDSLPISNNGFMLDAGPFSHQILNVNLITSTATVNPDSGKTNISLTGTSLPDFTISSYYISVNDILVSNTTCYINMLFYDSGNQSYFINGSNLSCELLEVGNIGQNIRGSYNGTINFSVNNAAWTTGTISGNFDIIRTQ
ncbi:MAG TPA: carboxypeptidase regulatory-like domain-containing protein [Bacteroidia bacterium]|nr:carboxypeptidase regulatory-like domain-containing protein [Bacteroidia bacterium]